MGAGRGLAAGLLLAEQVKADMCSRSNRQSLSQHVTPTPTCGNVASGLQGQHKAPTATHLGRKILLSDQQPRVPWAGWPGHRRSDERPLSIGVAKGVLSGGADTWRRPQGGCQALDQVECDKFRDGHRIAVGGSRRGRCPPPHARDQRRLRAVKAGIRTLRSHPSEVPPANWTAGVYAAGTRFCLSKDLVSSGVTYP
jgi:hypothetical protein